MVDEGTRVVERTVTRTVTESEPAPRTSPEDRQGTRASEPEEPASEPEAATEEPEDLVVGDAAATSSGNEITIHGFEYVPADDFNQPEPGFRFAAIDAEGCANPDSETSANLSPYDFSLQMPDNTRLNGDFFAREPALEATTVLPGDCVRGWVTYQIPEGEAPASVVFTGSSIIKWAVQDIAAEARAPEEVMTQQYEYLNVGDFDAAYDLFAEQSQQIVSREQYLDFFQSYDFFFVESYSFLSVQEQVDTATVEVAITNSTSNGEEQYQVVQQLVREDGGWRILMRDAQVENFTSLD